MWWPFKKEPELELSPESQRHYDQVIERASHPESSKAMESTSLSVPTFSPDGEGQRVKTLKQVAMDNCVEFERAYSKCLVKGSYFERFASCEVQHSMYEQCRTMQIEALQMLNYAGAVNNQQRAAVKALADDLMIEAVPTLKITEDQIEFFNKLVGEAASKKS